MTSVVSYVYHGVGGRERGIDDGENDEVFRFDIEEFFARFSSLNHHNL